MRRTLLLLSAAALAFVGFVQLGPQPSAPPDFGGTDVTTPDGAAAQPSAWYCPWVEAGDVVDTDIVVASLVTADVGLTLLDPVSNTDPVQFPFEVVGPGGAGVDVGSVSRRGESPAIVEVSDGPAAVMALQHSDGFVSGDRCTVSVPKRWYLTGGSTKTGTFTELRLFNPFADNADVSVTAYSEFDLDLVAELESFDVAGRSWTTIDMEPLLPFRDQLVFTVETSVGLVIPTLIRSDERGQASIPGSGPSTTWEFPIVTPGDLEPFISVMSAGGDDITVTVDIVTETGTVRNAREAVVGSETPALIPLSDIAAAPYGVRLRATSEVAASVIALVPEAAPDEVPGGPDDTTSTTTGEGDQPVEEPFLRGVAGTVGAASPSSQWIVPFDTLLDAATTVWIMNTGTEPATVTLQPLAENEEPPFDVVVEPETTLAVPVDVGLGIYGFWVDSTAPVSVAWEIVGDRGVALVAGVTAR
ncbi:MAG: hypothetical protein KDB69_00615 [Acidimicrobiia bacterium]|nr:hypothetical protein [Acidimicrobiia bacterium]